MQPVADVQRALVRSLHQDVADLREQLHAAQRENKALRRRLQTVLNCVDAKCAVCARCLAAVREDTNR